MGLVLMGWLFILSGITIAMMVPGDQWAIITPISSIGVMMLYIGLKAYIG